jgi:hypothetical protein
MVERCKWEDLQPLAGAKLGRTRQVWNERDRVHHVAPNVADKPKRTPRGRRAVSRRT